MARTSLIPGFRFHPTDVELVMYYLKRKLLGKKISINAIAEVNIYDFSPWDLPDKSSLKSGDLEWYFFCPKAKKYSSGSRSNRSTETGFWKATGKDRNVKYNERVVATIKTLVFHRGHAGKGQRTNWVMHEYKMEDEHLANVGIVQDMYVLCKVYEKSGSGPKNGAHYGALFNEKEWGDDLATCIGSPVVGGLVGASSTADAQKGPATMSKSEQGSSIVTFSSIQHTNSLNKKQNGLAAMTSIEPDQPTHTLNDKQKGAAAMNLAELGSSIVTFSTDLPTGVLNDKQKGPAAMNMAVTQTMNVDVMLFKDIDLPADDVMFFEDIDLIMGGVEEDEASNVEKVKNMVTNEDGIYDDLLTLIDLDDLNEINFKIDGADYTHDKLRTLDDLDFDLGEFYID